MLRISIRAPGLQTISVAIIPPRKMARVADADGPWLATRNGPVARTRAFRSHARRYQAARRMSRVARCFFPREPEGRLGSPVGSRPSAGGPPGGPRLRERTVPG